MSDFFDQLSPDIFAPLAEHEAEGVELDDVREVLRMYTRALTGINTQVMTSDEMYNKGLAWVSLEAQDLGGGAVLLPDVVERWPAPDDNFAHYKLLAAHQAGHLEAGTLGFSLDRRSTLFADLRPRLAALAEEEHGIGEMGRDFLRFFSLFTHRKLAIDLFNIFEDYRADTRLLAQYRGIRSLYGRTQESEVGRRPRLAVLPLREAAAETLFRHGTRVQTHFLLPGRFLPQAVQAAGLMNLLAQPQATVEDSAEAAVRAYCLLRRVLNLPASAYPADDYGEADYTAASYDLGSDDPDFWLHEYEALNTGGRRRRRGDPMGEPGEVIYKGIPGSEFQQHLSFDIEQTDLTELTLDDLDQPLAAELAEIVEGWDAEADGDAEVPPLPQAEARPSDEGNGNGLPHDLSTLAPQAPGEAERVPGSGMDRDLCEGEPAEFVYPEWDCREEEYRANWCTLWQRQLKEGSLDFFWNTLRRHHYLVSMIEKRFEMLRPELRHLQRGLIDGDEFDLDRLVEARVEKRAAGQMSEKIYQRRHNQERSVSVLFLLDMSISTSEPVELTRRGLANAGWGAYGNPEFRRIIDVEKESLVVLTRALEKVGDRYGIYGFSGRGRNGTRFYVVKDMAEPLTETVMARMDTIAPVQATRMGPAIRHAVSLLDREPSKTRILVLISDGQPQDLDYGSEAEGGRALPSKESYAEQREQEKEYAVSDTHRALREARARGIVPYLLSIDRHGYDYLRIMCGDFGYEVLHDIRVLPQRLVSLYNLLAR